MDTSKGLGDAIYLRAIALHLLAKGEKLIIYTRWPLVFADLGVITRGIEEITDNTALRHATYTRNQATESLDQFSAACVQFGLTEKVELSLRWRVRNTALVDKIRKRARGRKILIFQNIKKANDHEQSLMRPHSRAFLDYIGSHKGWFRVRTGNPVYLKDGPAPCELDLSGKASITDMFDLGTIADQFFSDASYLTVLAESLDKPHVCMFSRRGITSDSRRARGVTPQRIFHKPHLATALYDEAA